MYINELTFNVFLVGCANRQRLTLTGSPSASGYRSCLRSKQTTHGTDERHLLAAKQFVSSRLHQGSTEQQRVLGK